MKVVQSGMDNRKLIENIVSDVKGERLMCGNRQGHRSNVFETSHQKTGL